jgi:hypothetical protein
MLVKVISNNSSIAAVMTRDPRFRGLNDEEYSVFDLDQLELLELDQLYRGG